MLFLLFILLIITAVSLALYVAMPWSLASWIKRKRQLDVQSKEAFETVFLFFSLASLRTALSVALGLSYFLLVITTGSWLIALLAPTALMTAWPALLRAIQTKRQRKVCRQLPDFIQALALSSRAGLGVQTAFIQLVPLCEPLRSELELCIKEQQLGITLQQTLQSLYLRVPHEGTQLLASSLTMVQRSGGRIADILERLALSLRTQLHLEDKVKALTAQATLQAWVMAVMPLFIAMSLSLMQPELMRPLWTEFSGWVVIGIVLLLEFVGLRLLIKIARIQV